jgi:Eukaryotic initiation factor 4E
MTGPNRLSHPYVFSYMRRGGSRAALKPEGEQGATTPTPAAVPPVPVVAVPPVVAATAVKPADVNPYETSINTIATVSTVQEFWNIYDFLKRPNDLPTTTDYHFFREGIKPTWEDVRDT